MENTANTESAVSKEMLQEYATATIEKESSELMRLVNLVTDAVSVELVNGEIVTTSKLSSAEIEVLVLKIPAECLRLQTSLNRYNVKNVFRDIAIEAEITKNISTMIGTKGNAEERKRKAELLLLDERTVNAVNKSIIKALQGCIDRADKVYEGLKKILDYRAKEGWFDRKGP